MNISSDYFLYINIGIIVVYLIFILVGYIKGFLYEVVSLIYTGLALGISWFVAPVLASVFPIIKLENLYADAQIISKFININSIIDTIIYFVIIFLVLRLLYIVIALGLKGFNKIPVLGSLNKILGGFSGVISGTVVVLLLSLLLSLPIFENGKEVKEKTLFNLVGSYSTKALNYAVDNLNLENFSKDIENFDVDNARQQLKVWIDSLND